MSLELLQGDCLTVLRTLPDEIAQTCVTSPPYWGLRDYGTEGQLGLEKTPEEYVAKLVEIFREVRRVLKKNGTLWLNLGDSYAGSWGAEGRQGKTGELAGRSVAAARQIAAAARKSVQKRTSNGVKPKDLVGIPWMVAFALRADGWWLRSDIIWHKPNCMPLSVTDRPTTNHEYVFLLSRSPRYLYNQDAIREPMRPGSEKRIKAGYGDKYQQGLVDAKGYRGKYGGKDGPQANPLGRNKRTVWTITTSPYKGAHFATYPPKLIRPCILAGSGIGDLVIDPFNGAGTTGLVALEMRRRYLGIELNADYLELTRKRLSEVQMEMFA